MLATDNYPERTSKPEIRADYTGVYDPAKDEGRGVVRLAPNSRPHLLNLRLIGGMYYLQNSYTTWQQEPG